MTNFEKYKDEILKISKETKVAVDKTRNTPTKCLNISCEKCLLYSQCDEEAFVKWLYAEHQEPAPKLTKAERGFCEIVKEGWIARDKNESLSYHSNLPEYDESSEYWVSDFGIVEIPRQHFNFITWKSGKAWSIEDLLKLEVEDE